MIQTAFISFLASLLLIPAVFLLLGRSKAVRSGTSAVWLVFLMLGAVVAGAGF